MKRPLAFAFALSVFALPGSAQDLSALAGTYDVTFVPMQSAGIRQGCSLVFKTAVQDSVYGGGKVSLLVGNIAFVTNDARTTMLLSLKLGVADNFPFNTQTEPPLFAYVQGAGSSTARSKTSSSVVERGYRIFAIQIDDKSAAVLADIVENKNIIIGYNRRQGGLDVLAPLDLSVEDAYEEGGKIKRKHSQLALNQFRSCFAEITGEVEKATRGAR